MKTIPQVLLAFLGILAASTANLQAQTIATWNLDNTGNWNVDANWTYSSGSTFPNGIDHEANLTFDITANRSVTIPTAVAITIGTLRIGDPAGTSRYTLQSAGTGTLTFDVTSGSASIIKSSGDQDSITAAITLNDDLVITNTDDNPISLGSGAVAVLTGLGRTVTIKGSGGVNTAAANRIDVGSGTVAVTDGGLLNLGGNSNTVVNGVNTSANLVIGGNSTRASTLRQGNSGGGGTASQTFGSLALQQGLSTFSINTSGSGSTNQLNLDFGTSTYSRQDGSVLHWAQVLNTFGTRALTTATSASMDFGGNRLVVGAVTTGNTSSAGNASAIQSFVKQDSASGAWSALTSADPGYALNPTSPTANTFAAFDNTGVSVAGGSSMASLQLTGGTTGSPTVNFSGVNTIGSGMILMGRPVATNAGGALIAGGTIRSGTDELIVIAATPGTGNLTNTINSIIADGTGGATSLTVALTGNATNSTRLVLGGGNTYSGDTVIVNNVSTNANNYLQLASSGQMLFEIGANAVNNKVTGAGNFLADGTFYFDLSAAVAVLGNEWSIIGSGISETFGSSFAVNSSLGAFTQESDVWTLTSGGDTWSFAEATGILSVIPVPEPSTYALMVGGTMAALLIFRGRRPR